MKYKSNTTFSPCGCTREILRPKEEVTRYYVAAKFIIAAELAGPKLRRHIFTPDTY